MVEPPLLTLDTVTLGFGGDPLFSGLSLAIAPGDRLCLVGRNGTGKSTLMKVMAGVIDVDDGGRMLRPGASVSRLAQEPDFTGFSTLGDFASADLDISERHKAERVMDALDVPADADPEAASGGEKRRAALARCLAGEPDLMLLDEPTNHLDIHAIEWLEGELARTRRAFVLISHDRRFLARLTRATLWLDRGICRRAPQGFDGFEDWRDKAIEEERAERHKLDRLIKAEGRWAVEGISARRKRNMGRVRRLADLRETRAGQIAETGRAAMALETGQASGKLVIEATDITRTYGERQVIRPFSTRIARGDRVALVGPNGAGKTTLLNMLTGQVPPDTGAVKVGARVEMVVFDQTRSDLDPEKSLWETLTDEKLRGPKSRTDQIMVRGQPQHVVGYLKSFLFDETQARGPVASLSGGERARLLLAKLMARSSNLLVLDEPTNDLDLESLDLLQELLADFDGTVLFVSHDRDFIDRVATSTIAIGRDGHVVEYAGGWSDHLAQGGGNGSAGGSGKTSKSEARRATKAREREKEKTRLSFAETRRLELLPAEMDQLTREIGKLEAFLAEPDLYAASPAKFTKATAALTERQAALSAAEEEWLSLEEKRETLEGG